MAKAERPKNEAERLLQSKVLLIKRLREEIRDTRADAEARVEKIEGRIRIAQTLADALKKGTLKP